MIHKLHRLYLELTEHLAGFWQFFTDCPSHQNPKSVGRKLINYLVAMAQEGAIQESRLNYFEASQLYHNSLFLCDELLRDLSNTLKFSMEVLDPSED